MSAAPIRADDLFAAWARQQWKRVYLFAGSEDFLIEEATKTLSKAKLAENSAGVNYEPLDGDDVSAEAILQAFQTMPFGGSNRLIEVRNTSRLSPENQKRLAEGLSRLPASATLVLLWGKEWRKDDALRPLSKAALQAGELVIFWPLFPEHAQRWLIRRAQHYKKTLTPESAAWLTQETEQGLRFLDQELQKACCYVGERSEITLEDVQAAFGYRRAASPYAWINAIRQKDNATALQTLRQLLEEGEEPIRLLAMISGSVRDWLAVKGSNENPQSLAWRFHLKRGEEGPFLRDLEKLSEKELLEGLSGCVDTQLNVKTGKENPEMALTLLTLRLCGAQPVPVSG